MKKQRSDFGKGLVYNLVLFANHFSSSMAERIGQYNFVLSRPKEVQNKILVENPTSEYNYGWNKEVLWWLNKIVPIYGSPEKALSHKIVLWVNGASDHLYEIEVPKQWKRKKVGKLINKLKNKGLKMGHGFTGKIYTFDDFVELIDLTNEIALLVDKELGLKPIKAKWE